MKNFLKLFGIIALVMAVGFFMTSCDPEGEEDQDDPVIGKLTIVGFDFDIDEVYVMADAWLNGVYYFAAEDFDEGEITLGEIKNKIVTLNIWEHKGAEPVLYSGSMEIDFNVYLFASETALDDGDEPDDEGTVKVKFNKGIGIGSVIGLTTTP